ncbi:MAG: Ig-like domain-containing protein [Clostridiales bacterium]|nr:Ig-like domain-containing protein [Clostridiales bacterium]
MKRSIISILISLVFVFTAVSGPVFADTQADGPAAPAAAAEETAAPAAAEEAAAPAAEQLTLAAEIDGTLPEGPVPVPESINVRTTVPEGTTAIVSAVRQNDDVVYTVAFRDAAGASLLPDGSVEVQLNGDALLCAWKDGAVGFYQEDGTAAAVTEEHDALLLQADELSFRISLTKTPGETPDVPGEDEKYSLENAVIQIPDVVYTGKPLTPALIVTLDGAGELTSGRDYEAVFSDNVNAGSATVTVTGCGDYEGTASQTFTIAPKSLSGATVSGVQNKAYTGAAIQQTPTVKLSGTTLRSGTDYTITYQNNKAVGKATLKITGTGNYTGTVTKTFTITDSSARSFRLSSGAIRIKTAAHAHYRLPGTAKPFNLLLTERGGSAIELKWTDCVSRYGADIDGYIILRKTRYSDPYAEIARVGRKTNLYTDKSSKSKSAIYYYMVIGYKKNSNGVLSVSDSQVAAGVTATSPKLNPYWPTINATKVSLKEKGTKKLTLNFSKYKNKSCTTWTRWRSSNPAVATVDSKGLVTAKSPGTATITARTANGRNIDCVVHVYALTTAEQVCALAKSQVGYKGTGSGSYGNRYSKYAAELDAMGDVYNYPKNGYDWCDIFADWCYIKVMGKERAIAAINQPKYGCGAGCYYSAGYYRDMGRFSSTPSIGAQIFFDWGGDGVEDHTGIVIGYDSTSVYTIEGNTGGGTGEVAARTYARTDKRIVGYGLPKW